MIEFKIQQVVERNDGSREVSFRIMQGTWQSVKNRETDKFEDVFVRTACLYRDTVTLGMNTMSTPYPVKFLILIRSWAVANGHTLADILWG